MIMLADSRAKADLAGMWPANLDPTQGDQWHSNRHNRRTDIMFANGHAGAALRDDAIDPAPSNVWRARWNNDKQPHNAATWTVDWPLEAQTGEYQGKAWPRWFIPAQKPWRRDMIKPVNDFWHRRRNPDNPTDACNQRADNAAQAN